MGRKTAQWLVLAALATGCGRTAVTLELASIDKDIAGADAGLAQTTEGDADR